MAEQQANGGFEGGCTCGGVRFRAEWPPLIESKRLPVLEPQRG